MGRKEEERTSVPLGVHEMVRTFRRRLSLLYFSSAFFFLLSSNTIRNNKETFSPRKKNTNVQYCIE